MKNDYLDTKILIPEDALQVLPEATVSGQIIFTPKTDLNIQEIGYQVVMLVGGNINPYSKVLTQKIFLKNTELKKGQSYNYNFEFITSSPSSYNGENISITWKIESIVNLNNNSYLQIRNDYLKKNRLPNHQDTKTLLWKKGVFEVLESGQPYAIDLESETIDNSPYFVRTIFGGCSIFIIFLPIFFHVKNPSVIISITFGFLFLVVVLPYLYKLSFLEKIKVDIKPLGKYQFMVLLDLTRNWKGIQKVSVSYSVFEEVLDRREEGKRKKYESKIYESRSIKKHKIKFDKNDVLDFPEITYDFIFDFPKEKFPSSLSLSDLKVSWKINITVYFFGGLSSTFVKNINVRREELKEGTPISKHKNCK